jgi:hypothetical protein
MAKKQTRRSISVSRTTYERLKAFCETNHISMSQLVETRVNDFLGPNETGAMPMVAVDPRERAGASMVGSGLGAPGAPRPVAARPLVPTAAPKPVDPRPQPAPAAPSNLAAQPPAAPPPMTSAAARFAVDPPPPIIKPRQDTAAPKPAEKRPEQIFTF